MCPVHGVRAIAVSRPARPRLLRALAGFRSTTSEDVWARRVETPSFRGDLVAVGIQRCDPSARFGGLAVYDVTRPARPRLLARLSSGVRTRAPVREVGVRHRREHEHAPVPTPDDRELVDGRDVRIVEITNPRRRVELAHWDFRRDAPAAVRRGVVRARGRQHLLDHSASPYAGGMRMFASHWDAGAVFLDISDAARPRYVGRTRFRRGEDGNAHSGWFRADERIFVQNDEDLGPLEGGRFGWGFQRIFDLRNPVRPVRMSRFALEDAVAGRDGRIGRDGRYAVHNNVFVGNVQYVSWYSSGVRVVDLSNAARPREIAHFIPPPARDPQGYWEAPDGSRRFPLVWGVYPYRGLVFASDINSGLWIFRVRRR